MVRCRDLFIKKMKDYGTAWRILRLSSLVDQIFIKARRIRNIEESITQKIEDSVASEYIGIINYALMAMIQMDLGVHEKLSIPEEKVLASYDALFTATRVLMLAKNHDYGEAWRMMQLSSLTDLILMKVLRVKQIQENDGKTLVSEGLQGNFQDMLNYSMFALIKIAEKESIKPAAS
jgi:hypothetical protein